MKKSNQNKKTGKTTLVESNNNEEIKHILYLTKRKIFLFITVFEQHFQQK